MGRAGKVKVSRFWKLAFWGLLALVVLIATFLLEKDALSSRKEKPVFKPPLKGTEILLEATQHGISMDERGQKRGIWALDLDTGKMRLLIPDGEHPVWEPQHNYFAYRKDSGILIAPRSGAYAMRVDGVPACDLWEPVGWGPNERWFLFLAPYGELVYPQKASRLRPGYPRYGIRFFQDIFLVDLTLYKSRLEMFKYPSYHYLADPIRIKPLDTFKKFPFHHCGNPSISPDGRHIVFEVFRYASGVGKLNSKIAIAEIKWMEKESRAELENVRRLTQLPEDLLEVNPHWSPDGKMIAFDVIDPKDATRTPHVIRIDGTGLKGWKLSREDLGRERIRLQDGLTKTEHEDEVRVLDWLADGRLVLVQAKPASTTALTDRIVDIVDVVWVVDLQHRHPPLKIQPKGPEDMVRCYVLLALSPSRRQLAWLEGPLARADRSINASGIEIFDIPPPEDREALRIIGVQQEVAELKNPHSHCISLSGVPEVAWEVYWLSW